MKECAQVGDLFGELHDGKMEVEAEKSLREHLNGCTDCREDFKWYGFTMQALTSLEQVSPPPNFMTQLEAKLYQEPQPFSFKDFFSSFFSSAPYMPLPIGVTSLVFLVVVGVVVYNHAPSGGVSSAAPVAMHAPTMRPTAESGLLAGVVGKSQPDSWQPRSVSQPTQEIPPGFSPNIQQFAMTGTQPVEKKLGTRHQAFRTVADVIGADNLTVESPSIEHAVESLKKALPNLHGQLVTEKFRDPVGERVLGVLIPSGAYGHLTSELINHGAVAVGAGSENDPPPPSRKDENTVILYIRFTHSR